jgi:opacity protein-like surface antigen
MRNLLSIAASLAALSAGVSAQDKITLANDDVLTGTIKTMADGKVTISSPLLGDVTVPMSNIKDMVTQAQVDLATKNGDLLKRRIVGVEGGNLRLEGDTTSLSLDNLAKINPPPVAPAQWTGSMKLNALWTDGNTDRRAVGASFDASLRLPDDRISADAAWDYSEDKDGNAASATFRDWKLNQRRAGAGLKYDHFLGKRWYFLITSRVLGDTLADLDLRFSGGAGLGYTFIEDSTTTVVTEAGLSYVNENYRSATPSDDYLAARLAYKVTHAFTATTKLVHSVEAFPSTEDIEDFYLQGKTEIVTSLTESMIASLGHVIDYDNTPAPGRDRVDNRVLLSVGWSF